MGLVWLYMLLMALDLRMVSPQAVMSAAFKRCLLRSHDAILSTQPSGFCSDCTSILRVVHWGCGDIPRAEHACSERGLYGRPPGGNQQRVRARGAQVGSKK